MKKALSVFLASALAFGAFAQETPVAESNIAEFSGWASVDWGVDLDTGTTGFKNESEIKLRLNLLGSGYDPTTGKTVFTKSTTGDGLWGELELKYEEKFADPTNNPDGTAKPAVSTTEISIEKARLHIGPAYIGIKRGDTVVGKLKMDAAIRSADPDEDANAIIVGPVGPADYVHGIETGFENDMVKVALDLRSKMDQDYQYTDNYAAALEGELKGEGLGLDGLSVKAGVAYNFGDNYMAKPANWDTTWANGAADNATAAGIRKDDKKTDFIGLDHALGYSASAGYKLGLGDFYLRPQVGFVGTFAFDDDNDTHVTSLDNKLALGVLFGWGEIGLNQDAGVYYLDNDNAKRVSPGVGVVVQIPFDNVATRKVGSGDKFTTTTKDTVLATITPSFYSGEIIPGLTAAAYADMWIMSGKTTEDNKVDGNKSTSHKVPVNKDLALGLIVAANYEIQVGEFSIIPGVGLRFANGSYVENANSTAGALFDGLGKQKYKADDASTVHYDESKQFDGNFMNLKLGVDVKGLIDNTTLSLAWSTRNLLNDFEYTDQHGPKLGTLNFKAKISL